MPEARRDSDTLRLEPRHPFERPMFAYPVRPWEGCKTDARFLEVRYFDKFQKWHKGIDINLKTGGNSDFGYPVQSMFPGEVIFAKRVVGTWGGIVVVRADAATVQHAADMTGIVMDVLDVQYAHLEHVTVRAGDLVRASDHVGTIGRGTNTQYIAHLHLEMRRTVRDPAEPQGGDDNAKLLAQTHYLDPEQIMDALNLSDFGR